MFEEVNPEFCGEPHIINGNPVEKKIPYILPSKDDYMNTHIADRKAIFFSKNWKIYVNFRE